MIVSEAEAESVVEHVETRLKHTFPVHCFILRPPALRRFAEYGLARAQRHGVAAAGDVALYTQVMTMLGSHFDEDPLHGWLSVPRRGGPLSGARVAELHAHTLDFVDRTSGYRNDALHRALARIRAHTFLAPQRDHGDVAIAALIEHVFPERTALTGREALATLPARAREAAARHDLHDERAPAICAMLLFMLGSGFDADPQFPWVRAALVRDDVLDDEAFDNDRAIVDIDPLAHLHAAAMVHVETLMGALRIARQA